MSRPPRHPSPVPDRTGPPSPGRALVALSGGVDSSVAALLLLREGWRVEGVTLDLLGDGGEDGAVSRAARTCDALGIRHHVVDGREPFRRGVVEPFLREYRSGRTPNPCVRCNEEVKFALLRVEMERLGFDRIATGHYAVVGRPAGGDAVLCASPNRAKDQSYFLYRLSAAVLERLLLPVGSLPKERVRALALEAGLPAAASADSQDVCFLRGRTVSGFLEEAGAAPPPGELVDRRGTVLGRHCGIHAFTPGQRRGIGVAGPRPLYVHSLDPARNRVVVGERQDTLSGGAVVEELRFPGGTGAPPALRGTARIRHRHPGVACVAEPAGDTLRVRFDAPQGGVAPGQSLVLYDGATVLGGGIIRCPLA